MVFARPIQDFYSRNERQFSSLFLILGFVLDVLTLKRSDRLFENLWIIGYIVLIGIFILALNFEESDLEGDGYSSRAHFWYLNALQFCFGGVLSANLVLYFRSADLFSAWPFILILAVAFWANESLRQHQARFNFQVSLYFFGIYSFFIFFLPVVFHRIGAYMFIAAGMASVAVISIFLYIVFFLNRNKLNENKKLIFGSIAGIFIVMNILYFTNLIPPMPLALKDSGAYHSIVKTETGRYEVLSETKGWQKYLDLFPDFHKAPGETVFVYSAIFSPSGFELNIVHVWQYHDPSLGWVTDQSINLAVRGGRDGGFRTYSARQNLRPGKWRVRVETASGQDIGRIRFEIKDSETQPGLITIYK